MLLNIKRIKNLRELFENNNINKNIKGPSIFLIDGPFCSLDNVLSK